MSAWARTIPSSPRPTAASDFGTQLGRAFVSVIPAQEARRVNGESKTKELPPASTEPADRSSRGHLERPSSDPQTGEVGCPPPLRRFRAEEGPHRIGAKPCFPTSPVTTCSGSRPGGCGCAGRAVADVQAIVASRRRESGRGDDDPHPPSLSAAETPRISSSQARQANADGRGLQLAITPKGRPNAPDRHGRHRPEPEDGGPTLGYWLGMPSWGEGYATEAARALIDAFFAYTATSSELVGVGAGHQPGLAAGPGEVRLRLSWARGSIASRRAAASSRSIISASTGAPGKA